MSKYSIDCVAGIMTEISEKFCSYFCEFRVGVFLSQMMVLVKHIYSTLIWELLFVVDSLK